VIDMRAIARGDKGWRGMIEQSLKAKLKEFASGRSERWPTFVAETKTRL
jgi:hypothetical protein